MNSTTLKRVTLIPILFTLFSSAAIADTSSQPNVLWHNSTTGAIKFMPVNGMTPESTLSVVDSSNTNLLPKGMGDFTGDGLPDILFHNQNSGNLRIWEMDGTAKVENTQVLGSSNTNLKIAGVGDFDGDGDKDIATFNTNSGALRIWVMEGTVRVNNISVLTGANTNLVPRGAGDMNNDGIPDIVLRNNNSGTVRVWTMNSNFTRQDNVSVTSSSNTNLELRGVMDINSDGNNDILNYNTNTGKLRAWLMDGNLKITENAEVIQDVDLAWSVRGGYYVVDTLDLSYNYITFWKQIASDLDEHTYYNSDYLYSSIPDIGNCDMGALSEDAKQRVLLISNYIRELHGLSPLNYNYGFDDEVQASSLIMKANNTMTHHPSSSSLCYTEEGYTGSSTSNIYSGHGIVDPVKHIIGWIDDSRNISALSAVSHRRWALNPFGEYLTYGQNEGFATLKAFGFDQTYNTDIDIDYVAFPYKRYPYLFLSNNSAYPTPWSFSVVEQKDTYFNNSFDYFNDSTITVREKTSGTLLNITNQYYDKATYGLANILSWQVSDWKYDTLYEVTIANVNMQNEEVESFIYEVFIDYKDIITISEKNEYTDYIDNNSISGTLYNNLDEDSFVVNLSGTKTFTGENSVYSNMAFFINIYDSHKQLIKASDEPFTMYNLKGNYTIVISHTSKETGRYYTSDDTVYTVEIN